LSPGWGKLVAFCNLEMPSQTQLNDEMERGGEFSSAAMAKQLGKWVETCNASALAYMRGLEQESRREVADGNDPLGGVREVSAFHYAKLHAAPDTVLESQCEAGRSKGGLRLPAGFDVQGGGG
jgi:hypothetical protein